MIKINYVKEIKLALNYDITFNKQKIYQRRISFYDQFWYGFYINLIYEQYVKSR